GFKDLIITNIKKDIKNISSNFTIFLEFSLMYKSNWFLLIINKNKEIINGIVKIIYVLNWLNSNKLIEIRTHEIYADNKIEINFKWPTNGKLIKVK
mgnify:CR=1